MNSQAVLGGNDLQLVAFDGHDLVAQVTCQTGKDRLGRPHIEVVSAEVAGRDIEGARAALAVSLAARGWTIRDGRTACPACAGKLAPVGAANGK